MHLVSQGVPYSDEWGFLIVDFNRVVSERVTWALVSGRRHSKTDYDYDNRNQHRGTHF